MRAAGIDPIFLLAPTSTDERIAAVGKVASGYVYYVSLKGVTGSANLDVASIASKIPAIKAHVALPVGVGFGIRDAASARLVADVSDAVVIGSRLVQLLEEAPPEKAAELLTKFYRRNSRCARFCKITPVLRPQIVSNEIQAAAKHANRKDTR